MNNRLISLILLLFLVLSYSCNKLDDDAELIAKWKTQNETYFSNMKDSVGYVFYEVPYAPNGYGYYYKIIKQGNPEISSPLSIDTVIVNYRGKLVDGTVFGQTFTKNTPIDDLTAKPFKSKMIELIPGWIENLTRMKVGEIRTIVLPQQLAYGSYYMPTLPYSTLIFDIQLVSFNAY